jgi:hypothetical protein
MEIKKEVLDALEKALSNAGWLLDKYVKWGPDEHCALAREWLDDNKALLAKLNRQKDEANA